MRNFFWGEHGKRIDWIKPFTKVKNTSYDYHNVSIKWFEDGTLNVSANCIDRHLATRGDQPAIIWEGDDPSESKVITYKELHHEVNKFANVLHAQGVKKGDRVTIYLPMIPEAAYAMLACTRIGAVHSIVFGGFSPDSARPAASKAAKPLHRDHRRRRPARRPQGSAEAECRQGMHRKSTGRRT
jgi:acetyl-CoA synthetase